jgi:hypothetical protein
MLLGCWQRRPLAVMARTLQLSPFQTCRVPAACFRSLVTAGQGDEVGVVPPAATVQHVPSVLSLCESLTFE